MPDESHTLKYVEAAAESGKRARFVLIVMITASILAFGSFWNSRQGSWVNARLKRAKEAYELKVWNETARNALSKEDQKRFDDAKDFADLRGLNSEQSLKAFIEDLQKVQTEHINMIHIPFFGIILDVNDLGLLGGFTFVVILIWFRFSILREYSNLRLALGTAKQRNELALCYDLLAMHQVLTVPPVSDKPNPKLWGRVPDTLFYLPLIVHTVVLGYDIYTWRYGMTVSWLNTLVLFAFSLAFLALIAILTYLCQDLSTEADKEWKNAARELGILR